MHTNNLRVNNSNNLVNNTQETKRLRDIKSLSPFTEKENYKLLMKAFNSKTTSPHTQLLYTSNSITYNFLKNKNLLAKISSTKKVDILIKNFFLSLFTLISKPFYIDRQDKLIIRLFIYVAPKLEKNKLIRSLRNRNIRLEHSKDQLDKVSYSFPVSAEQKGTRTEEVGQILKGLTPYLGTCHSDPLFFSSVPSLKAQVENINKTQSIKDDLNTYLNIFKTPLEKLSLILGKYFKKQIEFEIIRLQYPFHDSNILSQILAYNAKKYNFRRMWIKLLPRAVVKNPSRNLFFKIDKTRQMIEGQIKSTLFRPTSYLPPLFKLSGLNSIFIKKDRLSMPSEPNLYYSYLSGINVRLGGRLMTQGLRARFSVQTKQSGSLARFKVDLVEKSRFTGKNKRGAYSFTVTMSHVIN